MFRTENSVGMLKSIAMIGGLAILLWSLGLPSLRFIEAANVSLYSDTLEDSAPSADSNHTIVYTATDGLTAGQNLTITFPAGFDLTGIVEDDVDLDIAGATTTTAAAPSGSTWGVGIAGQVITITSGTGVIAASDIVTIRIGDNAIDSGTGVNKINNPGPEGSYEVSLGGSMSDSGNTRVVILTAVTVTATVDTIFTFAVAGTPAGTAINGQSSTGATGSTTIPFGKLTELAATTSAQQLTVATNAANGYVVTVQLDQSLQSSTGEDINGFNNGSDVDVPATWAAPSGTLGSPDTYGHWGVTSDDITITDRGASQFADDLFIAASTSPRQVMQHTGPVASDSGVGLGTTTVGYRVEISALQQAGDYSTTLTYVATPTF